MSLHSAGSDAHETGPEKLGKFAHLTGPALERALLLHAQQAMFDALAQTIQFEAKSTLDTSAYFNASVYQGPENVTVVPADDESQPATVSSSGPASDAAYSTAELRAYLSSNEQFAVAG